MGQIEKCDTLCRCADMSPPVNLYFPSAAAPRQGEVMEVERQDEQG